MKKKIIIRVKSRELFFQKLVGLGLILMGIAVIVIASLGFSFMNDATFAFILIPLGIGLLCSKKIWLML